MEYSYSNTYLFCYLKDNVLEKLLEYVENLLRNRRHIERLADQGRDILNRREALLREIHSRKFSMCLEELHAIFHYRIHKKELVERWIKQYNVNEQDDPEAETPLTRRHSSII
ncbi:hypothetical protein GWI33_021173 [Rhynchophorus ferrugineus]|uniref:Uncharacterized protein n=1 Tax=Rhynchophorus ferrugineus TaxID=354439 RepID=A0A834M3H7_RHYFE|nr:hypothetical protein GWI33_021173 [Rhynchophorus ferrugineus]